MGEPAESRVERFDVRRTGRCAVRGPADAGAVRELWIVLHGYGQLATEIATGCSVLDDGTRWIVAPEALSRFYDARSDMDRHHQARVGASWMTREDRLVEIEDYVGWLQQVYESFMVRLDPATPVTVLGFSQGAAAASRWVARGTMTATHLICWGASIAPELDLSAGAALRRARCSIVIGARDKFVGADEVLAERMRLDLTGFPYEFVGFNGGHRLDDATLTHLATAVTP